MNTPDRKLVRRPSLAKPWILLGFLFLTMPLLAGCYSAPADGGQIVATVIVEIGGTPVIQSGVEGDDSGFAPGDSNSKTGAESIQRLIVREADIAITVEDTRAARDVIQAMVKDLSRQGAYVVSSVEGGGSETRDPTIYMTIRVPVDQYDEAMFSIANLAIFVTARTETSQDVTEEFADTQARLESMEAARDRLLEIMAGAETTEDLLDIEQQLTQREAEIEGLKGRLQYLSQTAQFSKITITISPFFPTSTPYPTPTPTPTPTPVRWQPGVTAKDAFDGLVDNLQSFIDFLIAFGIGVLPWLLIAGSIVFGGYWIAVRMLRGPVKKEPEE